MGYSLMPIFESEAKNEKEKKHTYCDKDCNHRDCKEVRELRNKKCNICGKPFKPKEPFYEDVKGKPEHARCVIAKKGV